MNKRIVFLLSATLLVALIAAGIGLAKGEKEQTYTGCLNSGGEIKNVAIGDRPLKECSMNETQISWNQTGPQGVPGVTGLYLSGLVGSTRIEECVAVSGKVQCEEKLQISFEVNEGDPIDLVFDDGRIQLHAEKIMPPFGEECQGESHNSGAYLICINIKTKDKTLQLGLSPALPLQQIHELDTCKLLKDSLVSCTLRADRTRQHKVQAEFRFKGARIAPYPAGADETQLNLKVVNKDNQRANAVISAPNCEFLIEPMAAQSVLLDGGESAEITFDLRADEPLVEGTECQIFLISATGRVMHEKSVAVPPPVKS